MIFDTQKALDNYLSEHPKADRSNHKVSKPHTDVSKHYKKQEDKIESSDRKFKITHRRYPDRDWDYKAVSTKHDGKEVIFSKDKKGEGLVETYSGKNYDSKSTQPSHSRRYEINSVPKKLKDIVDELKNKHNEITWSKAKSINHN